MTNDLPDPARITADDALLNQLAARDPAAAQAEPATGLLAQLAESLDREPIPARDIPEPAHQRRRLIACTAAAAVLLGCAGTAIAAVPARPGSPLYGVHSLLYGPVEPSPTQRAQAKLATARHDLDIAAAAARPRQDQHLAIARANLAAVAALIHKVSDATTARSLNQQLATLQARAAQLDQPDGANGQSGTDLEHPGFDARRHRHLRHTDQHRRDRPAHRTEPERPIHDRKLGPSRTHDHAPRSGG
jgi:hypothetical protein